MNLLEPIKIIKAKSEQEKERLISELWYFLNKANKMILGYTNSLGEPVQSVMLYVVDDDMNIYFGTLIRFPKYELLVQNPPLSIVVQDENGEDRAASLKAAIVQEISEPDEIRKIMTVFKEKNTCKYYLRDQDDFVIFKAKILSARLIDGSSGTLRRYDLNL